MVRYNRVTANIFIAIKSHTGDIQEVTNFTVLTAKSASLSCHFKILDSISSKLKPLVSGTENITNRSATKEMAPKRRKRFSAPRSSCRTSEHRYKLQKHSDKVKNDIKLSSIKELKTFNGENAKVTTAFEAKLVRTARLIPRPLVRIGKISDTISQLIGPNDICNTNAIWHKSPTTL